MPPPPGLTWISKSALENLDSRQTPPVQWTGPGGEHPTRAKLSGSLGMGLVPTTFMASPANNSSTWAVPSETMGVAATWILGGPIPGTVCLGSGISSQTMEF